MIKLKHILTEKKDLAPNIIADLAKMTDDEIIELIEDVKTRTIH